MPILSEVVASVAQRRLEENALRQVAPDCAYGYAIGLQPQSSNLIKLKVPEGTSHVQTLRRTILVLTDRIIEVTEDEAQDLRANGFVEVHASAPTNPPLKPRLVHGQLIYPTQANITNQSVRENRIPPCRHS
jgi:hypothetical protein